jgi:hypothetical protein
MDKPEWMMDIIDPWEQIKCDLAQKKILEYLIVDYKTFIDCSPLPQQSVNRMIGQLESMLKELDTINDRK